MCVNTELRHGHLKAALEFDSHENSAVSKSRENTWAIRCSQHKFSLVTSIIAKQGILYLLLKKTEWLPES